MQYAVHTVQVFRIPFRSKLKWHDNKRQCWMRPFFYCVILFPSVNEWSSGNITIKAMFKSGRGTQKAWGGLCCDCAVTERCRWGWKGSEIYGTVGVKALMGTWWWNCPKNCPLPRSPDIDSFSWILHGHSGTKPAENKDTIRMWHKLIYISSVTERIRVFCNLFFSLKQEHLTVCIQRNHMINVVNLLW